MIKRYQKFLVLFCAFSLIFSLSLSVLADEDGGAATEEQAEEVENIAQSSEEADAQTYSTVKINGALIEVGNTELPCVIVVRDSKTSTDYTVNLTEKTVLGQRRDQYTKLSDWIPGDQILVMGKKDDNTGVIEADVAANLSIVASLHRGINGWIETIDTANSKITVSWGATITTLKITQNTNIYIPGRGKITINDLKLKDRIRARTLYRSGQSEQEAKIIVVLRRGSEVLQKLRNNIFRAKLVNLASTMAPTTMTIEILKNLNLKKNDVNNLIGEEGDEKTVTIASSTKLVRRFNGKADLSEFSAGDVLFIVGAAQDDGTVLAKLVRNDYIWKASSGGYSGTITAIDTATGNLTVDRKIGTVTIVVVSKTKIIIGDIDSPTIADLKVGDKIRYTGTASKTSLTITADLIIVPASYKKENKTQKE